jgi:hypothetical protein
VVTFVDEAALGRIAIGEFDTRGLERHSDVGKSARVGDRAPRSKSAKVCFATRARFASSS